MTIRLARPVDLPDIARLCVAPAYERAPPRPTSPTLSQGQGPVIDDALHDEGGAEALDAGQRGELVVVDLLEGGQVAGDDSEEVVGVAGARVVLHARPAAARMVARASGVAMVVIGVVRPVERLAM